MLYLNLNMPKAVQRSLKPLCVVAATLLIGCASRTDTSKSEAKMADVANQLTFYVGTYAGADEESIYLYSLNPETGQVARLQGIKAGENPSYLGFGEDKKVLFSVNETSDFEGQQSGSVSAFSVEQEGRALRLIGREASAGEAPCYVSVANNTVLVANYGSGNVAALPWQEDTFEQSTQVYQHHGSGPHQERQEGPHAHYLAPSPDEKFAYAVDLGTDQVLRYKLGQEGLQPGGVAYSAAAGSGPRHLAFHPNGAYAYLVHELNSTLTVLRYSATDGLFEKVQVISTLPEGFTENNQPAAVKVSPDGRFVYVSNRGHNSIAVFAADAQAGTVEAVQHQSTQGNWPRDFAIAPGGEWLLVANERSNSISSFEVEQESGQLHFSGHTTEVPKPTCILFR